MHCDSADVTMLVTIPALLAMHNAVSFVNDLSAEELLIITKSVVHYQLVTSAVRRTKI